ncbi:uncharacterized protein BKA55DRAFT_549957 [Fusarium redolens]|uniref:Uncharacterized protein n=1 Tax=Fusarium redolens TaxID=48865 RepID=A0A9P9R9E3_FUSRE|nr:uncharacterized protein BKA55DRAFT_549957 [Fusarium redolens]KAH7269890.1 hypothetical protein BKA55DRAFT_549957 [Fusarium redolens]
MLAARYRLISTFSLIGYLPIHADNTRLLVIISDCNSGRVVKWFRANVRDIRKGGSILSMSSPLKAPETPIWPSIGVASDPLTPGRFQVPGFHCTRRRCDMIRAIVIGQTNILSFFSAYYHSIWKRRVRRNCKKLFP